MARRLSTSAIPVNRSSATPAPERGLGARGGRGDVEHRQPHAREPRSRHDRDQRHQGQAGHGARSPSRRPGARSGPGGPAAVGAHRGRRAVGQGHEDQDADEIGDEGGDPLLLGAHQGRVDEDGEGGSQAGREGPRPCVDRYVRRRWRAQMPRVRAAPPAPMAPRMRTTPFRRGSGVPSLARRGAQRAAAPKIARWRKCGEPGSNREGSTSDEQAAHRDGPPQRDGQHDVAAQAQRQRRDHVGEDDRHHHGHQDAAAHPVGRPAGSAAMATDADRIRRCELLTRHGRCARPTPVRRRGSAGGGGSGSSWGDHQVGEPEGARHRRARRPRW